MKLYTTLNLLGMHTVCTECHDAILATGLHSDRDEQIDLLEILESGNLDNLIEALRATIDDEAAKEVAARFIGWCLPRLNYFNRNRIDMAGVAIYSLAWDISWAIRRDSDRNATSSDEAYEIYRKEYEHQMLKLKELLS